MENYKEARVALSPADAGAWKIRPAKPSNDLHAIGDCPACSAPLQLPVPLDVVVTAAARSADTRLTRTFHCNCSEPHPKRPDATPVGCGCSWTVTIVRSGKNFTVEPADVEMVRAADELARAAATQVDSLRAAGEKWLGGVTAILGLLGIAGATTGKDTISALDTTPKLAAGVAVGIAVIAAAVAILFGYQAAYGWPQEIDVKNDKKLQDWFSSWTGRAKAAGDKLRKSVSASVVALGFLAVAVAFIWFGDPAKPPIAKLAVNYNKNGDARLPASVCGALLDSDEAQLHIKVTEGPTSRTETVPIAWVTKIATATTC